MDDLTYCTHSTKHSQELNQEKEQLLEQQNYLSTDLVNQINDRKAADSEKSKLKDEIKHLQQKITDKEVQLKNHTVEDKTKWNQTENHAILVSHVADFVFLKAQSSPIHLPHFQNFEHQ